MENKFTQRWYDLEPTLSLAVSMMQDAETDKQKECAQIILQKAKDFGLYIAPNKLEEAFSYFQKRWYDKEKEIADAFQYLKIMPFELQQEVSLEIIANLEK
ncbi:hypothetical protein IKJ53_07405 [bacterium]|nr:hypothetical protein [bacterium]